MMNWNMEIKNVPPHITCTKSYVQNSALDVVISLLYLLHNFGPCNKWQTIAMSDWIRLRAIPPILRSQLLPWEQRTRKPSESGILRENYSWRSGGSRDCRWCNCPPFTWSSPSIDWQVCNYTCMQYVLFSVSSQSIRGSSRKMNE